MIRSIREPLLQRLVSGIFLVRRGLSRWVGERFVPISRSLLSVADLWPKTRKSNPLSKLVRPWFEHQWVHGIVGVHLVLLLALFGVTGSPVSAEFPSGSGDASSEVEVSVVAAPKAVVITTKRQFQMPVELTSVSQGFYRYHPGVDLRAPLRSGVQPITEGVVREVVYGRWGYGQAVVVEHAGGYSSMYAHVGRIFVEPGSDVDRESVIAEVGTTGYSTGPHLHLEIYEDGNAINPKPLLGY